MIVIGYARVSTTDQDLSIQKAALRCRLRHHPRGEAQQHDYAWQVRASYHSGDVLIVTRIGRLARSINDPPGRRSRP
jgi:DNA invertase Pin-like site-specific DNA recombinase